MPLRTVLMMQAIYVHWQRQMCILAYNYQQNIYSRVISPETSVFTLIHQY